MNAVKVKKDNEKVLTGIGNRPPVTLIRAFLKWCKWKLDLGNRLIKVCFLSLQLASCVVLGSHLTSLGFSMVNFKLGINSGIFLGYCKD